MKLTAALFFLAATANAAITGTLVDERGKPLAGASIKAYPAEDLQVRRARLLRGDALAVTATAQSDENGRFKIEPKAPLVELTVEAADKQPLVIEAPDGHETNIVVVRAKSSRKLRLTDRGKPVANALIEAGPHALRTAADGTVDVPDLTRVSIMHPSYAPITFFGGIDEVIARGDVKLSAGVTIRGKVLSAAGEPVPGATLTVAGWPLGISGQDGSFTIAHAPSSWRFVTASEGGRIGSVTNRGASSYDIRLKPAATVTGTTMPGSRISISVTGDSDPGLVVIPGANGAFTSGPLPPGRYNVYAYRRRHAMGTTEVSLKEGERAVRAISPKPLAILRGRIVDEEQKPVAGAFIWSPYGSAPPRQELVMTGEKGEFAVVRPEPPNAPVVALKRGYALSSSGSLPPNKNDITMVMRRGFPLQVRVTSGREGLAGANVMLTTGEQEFPASRIEVACEEPLVVNCRTTSSAGTVDLRIIEDEYAIRVNGAGIVEVNRPPAVMTAKSTPVTIDVDRGVEVSGRVVFADGTPVVDAFVSALPLGRNEVRAVESDGSFVLTNVPAGLVTVTAATRDSVPLRTESVEVRAPARDVVLTVPTPARIEGRITDKDTGAPITSFNIVAQLRDGRSMAFAPRPPMQSEDGTFTNERAPVGALELHASAPGYARGHLTNITTEEGKTLRGVEVQLEKGGQVRGRVTAGGEPVVAAAIRLATQQRPMTALDRPVLTDSNGEYFFDSLPAGERTIEFLKEAFVPARKSVEIVRGKETRLDVELDRGQELTGRVVDENGRPIAGAHAVAMTMMGQGSRGFRTDEAGNFTMSGLSEGRYTVRVSKEGYLTTIEQNVIVPATAALSLRMSRGGTITGQVSGLSADDVASVVVTAHKGDVFTRARASSDGSFTLRGVPDGQVPVNASILGGRRPRQAGPYTVEVVNGSASPLQINFAEGFKVTGRVTRSGAPVTSGTVHFSAGATSRSADVASDGTYQVDGLPAGDYSVGVSTQAGPLFRGRKSVAGDIVFDIAIEGGNVRGRVVDATTGAPLSDVIISTVPSRTSPLLRRAVSDSDGRFILDAVTDGTFEIRTESRQNYVPATRSITVTRGSAPEVELRLDRTQATVFRVTDAQTGTPVDAMIAVNSGGKAVGRFGPARDADGAIRVYVAPGTYQAFINSRGYAMTTIDFTTPGPEVRVALALGARLMLTAAKPTRVRMTQPGGRPMMMMASDRGSYIEGLPAGNYTLEVLGEDGKTVVRSLPAVLTSGQSTTISVD